MQDRLAAPIHSCTKSGMKRRYFCGLILAITIAAVSGAQASRPEDKTTRSMRRPGPDGLEGWTLASPVAGSGYGDERFAFRLVIARHGHVIRRISGDPFIWEWAYWAKGRQIAYETGPFHFAQNCLLIRLSDGRVLEHYDCYHRAVATEPDWVKALDAVARSETHDEPKNSSVSRRCLVRRSVA